MKYTIFARRSGFTLVELLVVIGIISLLIAILLPALNKARAVAQTTACLSNVRQISLASFMYAADNQGYLPRYTEMDRAASFNTKHPLWDNNWTGLLFKYVARSTKVYECPARRAAVDASQARTWTPGGVGTESYGPALVTLQVNGVIVGGVNDLVGERMNMPFGPCWSKDPTLGTWYDNGRTMKLSQVASDTIFAMDAVRDRDFSSRMFKNAGDGDSSRASIRSIGIFSHNFIAANVAFADGSARTIQRGEFLKDSKFDVVAPITAATPSGLNYGQYGDLQLPNNTNRPRGYWTGARND